MIRKNAIIIITVLFLLPLALGFNLELNYTNGGLIDMATCPEFGLDCTINNYVYADSPDQSKMGVTSDHPSGKGESKIYAKFNLSMIPDDYNLITSANLSLSYAEKSGTDQPNIGCWEYYNDSWSSWSSYRKTDATWDMERNEQVLDNGELKNLFDVTEAVNREFQGDKIISFGLGNYTVGSWAYAYNTHIRSLETSFKLTINAVNCGNGKIDEGETCENCLVDYFTQNFDIKSDVIFSVLDNSEIVRWFVKTFVCSYSGDVSYKITNSSGTLFEYYGNLDVDASGGNWTEVNQAEIPISLEENKTIEMTYSIEDNFTKNYYSSYELLCKKDTTSCGLSCKKCPERFSFCEYSWESSCGSESGILKPGESLPLLICTSKGKCSLRGYYLDYNGGETTTTTTTVEDTTTISITTTTTETTTTIPEEELTIICQEPTTACHVTCKSRLCTSDLYEYCEYEWSSFCGNINKIIYPGDPSPWMVCNLRGDCVLKGKALEEIPATTTTTLPGEPEILCSEETTSCYHKCPICPSEFDYCEYNWISPCGSQLGTLQPGQHMPWLVCWSRGNCTLIGYN